MEDKRIVQISVVTPVYGCSTNLRELYLRLVVTLKTITPDFEIIMVNDNSPDNAWETIIELAQRDQRVKGINLSRNFGQHYAISAGLHHCCGDWVVVMDCDLQDQPEEILKLYQKAMESFLIVYAERSHRKDKWLKRILSMFFYYIFGYLTNTKQNPAIANFGIYHKKVIDSILSMSDYHRFFPSMVQWVGFKQTKIHVEHAQRPEGDSSYNFNKLVGLAVEVILSFSDKPLRLAIKFGFLISSLSIIFAIYNFVLYLDNKIIVQGYTSLIISIWFLSGIIILVLGVVGLYVGKTFDKVKGRPTYIIMDKTF